MVCALNSIPPASAQDLFTILLFLTLISTSKARPDFPACWNAFQALAPDNRLHYLYNGLLYGGAKVTESQRLDIISVDGCREFCGTGVGYYHWAKVSSTITTWVLPIIGTLLQAPFESNRFWDNIYAILRWVGSPFASLTYILWNIKVIGRSALLSDMSTSFEEKFENRSDASHMRDSLYILSVMNQYTVKSGIKSGDAESLLRIALFSDDFGTLKLKWRREELAKALREGRKRGIVPVFVTLMWFLFSLAISIQTAFGEVGQNVIAHDLALGLLLAWFPVLILSSIVDRNPVLTENARIRLNKLLQKVQIALRDKETSEKLLHYLELKPADIDNAPLDTKKFTLSWVHSDKKQRPDTLQDANNKPEPTDKINDLEAQRRDAGQGINREEVDRLEDDAETRYHKAEMEEDEKFLNEQPEPLACDFFTGFAGQGRVRWHYGVAHPVLAGMERIILDKATTFDNDGGIHKSKYHRNWLSIPNIRKHLIRGPDKPLGLWHFDRREFWEIISSVLIVAGAISGAFVVSFRTPTVGLGCRAGGYVIFGCISLGLFAIEGLIWFMLGAPGSTYHTKDTRKYLNRGLRVIELVSTAWLIYIVMAQTVGSYQTCECQSSLWGAWGGYIDIKEAQHATHVMGYWITGVLLSGLIMFIAIAFLVAEWCEQSHLNSEDFDKAMRGLARTRSFKKHTLWLRRVPNRCIRAAKWVWYTAAGNIRKGTEIKERTAVWETETERERQKAPTRTKYRDRESLEWSTINYD